MSDPSPSADRPDSRRSNILRLVYLALPLIVVIAIVMWLGGQRPAFRISFDGGSGAMLENSAGSGVAQINNALAHSRYGESGALHFVSEACPIGSCLRFDGYSNYLILPADTLMEPAKGFALRLWLAPSHIGAAPFTALYGQHDAATDSAIELGFNDDGQWGLRCRVGKASAELWSGEDRLSPNQWTQLAASYDPQGSVLSLYREGNEVASANIDASAIPASWRTAAYVGRSGEFRDGDGLFALAAYAGLMDQFEVYPFAIASDRAAGLFADESTSARAGWQEPLAEAAAADRLPATSELHRPGYHAHAAVGWTGRPMAPFYHEGRYHLFFLTNPKAPYPERLHWGHFVSEDLVNWQQLPTAMAPSGLPGDGLGAGSAVIDSDGQPVIFFTTSPEEGQRQPGRIFAARPIDAADKDLSVWASSGEAVIEQQGNQGQRGDFQDPFVFASADGKRHYALVGGMSAQRNGAIQVYHSSDLSSWEHGGEAFGLERSKFPNYGPMWVAPTLLPLGEAGEKRQKWILLVQTQGRAHPTVTYYWIGRWDEEKMRFVPDSTEGQRLDVSRNSLLAPTGFVDPQSGRSILFYHFDSEDTPQQRYQGGWANSIGLALSLGLHQDGSLRITPLQEQAKRRGELLVDQQDTTFQQLRTVLSDLSADAFEIDMFINMDSAGKSRVGLISHRHPEGTERTIISWDRPRSLLVLQRNKSSADIDIKALGNIGRVTGQVGPEYRVQLYVDRSMIESIFDERHILFGNAYPTSSDSAGIALLGSGSTKVPSFKLWRVATSEPAHQRAPAAHIAAGEWLWKSQLGNHDFASCSLEGWQAFLGDAFVKETVVNRSHYANDLKASFNPARLIPGLCHYWGLQAPRGDEATGELRSEPFTAEGPGAQLNFLIGGGNDPERLFVALVRSSRPDKVLMKATGRGSERYRRVFWDLSDYQGEELMIRVVDDSAAPMGHLNIDSFNLGAPPSAP